MDDNDNKSIVSASMDNTMEGPTSLPILVDSTFDLTKEFELIGFPFNNIINCGIKV